MATDQFTDAVAQPPAVVSVERPLADGVAHHSPRLELRCLGCGYGAISAELIRCPMCGDEAWDFAEWRPFSH
jgi:hypothetical protein